MAADGHDPQPAPAPPALHRRCRLTAAAPVTSKSTTSERDRQRLCATASMHLSSADPADLPPAALPLSPACVSAVAPSIGLCHEASARRRLVRVPALPLLSPTATSRPWVDGFDARP